MLVKGEFVRKNGKILWEEHYDLPELGCVYLCQRIADEPSMTYKLTRAPESNQWFWAALWNSCAIAGKNICGNVWQHLFPSVEAAIDAMLSQPEWRVWRAHFDGGCFTK
jgi:hypothetical protein